MHKPMTPEKIDKAKGAVGSRFGSLGSDVATRALASDRAGWLKPGPSLVSNSDFARKNDPSPKLGLDYSPAGKKVFGRLLMTTGPVPIFASLPIQYGCV
jgi:hypothetical protein